VIQDAVDRGAPIRIIDLPAICPAPDDVDAEGPLSAARRRRARDLGLPEPKPEPYVDVLGRKPGEALWPEVRPISFLEQLRASIGARQFGAQLQGRPRVREGRYFREEWFRTYDIAGGNFVVEDKVDGLWRSRLVPWAACIWLQYVDLATSLRQEADYFVVTTVAVDPARKDIFVANVFRDKLEGPDQIPKLIEQWKQWKPRYQKIESTGFQLSSVQAAVRSGLPALPIVRSMDKMSRANYIAVRYEQGAVFHPRVARWKAEFEDELLNFPRGHDDQVDTIADAGSDLLDEDLFTDGSTAAGGLYAPN
jgi:predicted phage terminase large subunit-like protein